MQFHPSSRTRLRFTSRFGASAAAATCLGLLAGMVSGQEIRMRAGGFLPISYYDLLIDGEKASQFTLYESDRQKTILVESSQLASLVELVPRTREYLVFDVDAFAREAVGLSDVPSGTPRSVAELEFGALGMPVFVVEGRRCELRIRDPYLGPATAADLLKYSEAYSARSAFYQPREPFLGKLKSVTEPVTVRVFLGTWCHSCGQFVPNILAIEKALAGTPFRFEYYGIPEDRKDPELQRLAIEGALPAVIVSRGGSEITRLQGAAWGIPELALHNALISAGLISP